MPKVSKKIQVVYKKLKRHQAHGLAFCPERVIEVDERLKGKKLLEILIHEGNHIIDPNADEDEIVKKSVILTNLLWDQGFRKIDNENSITLQDGSK